MVRPTFDFHRGLSDGEEIEERLRILQETRQLRVLAEFFLHPEKPVRTEPTTFARCYFERNNATQPLSQEESEEAAKILAEMKSMKKLSEGFAKAKVRVAGAVLNDR